MPNASLNANPQHEARIGYSGFDMSQQICFTSSTGQVLPVYYDFLSPGDKVDCRAIIKTRTAPLLTAAEMSLTEHVEWFFVPAEQIFSPFGNFYYGIEDYDSAVFKPMNGSAKAFDRLPYGNLFELIGDPAYQLLKSSIDDVGDNAAKGWFRLLDCLGVPVTNNVSQTFDGSVHNFPLSPLFFCAYQKIYYDFYRLTDRESNQPAAYNLDDLVVSGNFLVSTSDFVTRFGRLHYRPWKRDFFKSNTVSPLFGSQSINAQPSIAGNLLNEVNQWLTGLSAVTTGAPTASTTFTNGGNLTSEFVEPTSTKIGYNYSAAQATGTGVTALATALNPSNLRTLFASEKLLEITRRAGKHYDKQTLAHWGVKVPAGTDGEVQYLGAQHAQIHIGDVVSQAATQFTDSQGNLVDTPLGEIAGKGFTYGSGNSCKFEAKCHGVLMAIYSAEPDAHYDQEGLDKLMTLIDRSDFVIPEYENLGMQPLFNYQLFFSDTETFNSQVMGWQYRYQEFKQKYDRVFGGFCKGQSLQDWVHSVRMTLPSLEAYLIQPNTLNDIMVYKYQYMRTGQPATVDLFINTQLYNGDPLYHFFYFDVKKSSKMSVYGLPSL